MEVLILIAITLLTFMLWQLYRAKKFNKFKELIDIEITPQLLHQIEDELVTNRSKLFPNEECHIQASIAFWTQSRARIIQAALEREIISEKWLKDTGNYRNCQHLFYIEKQYLLAPDRVKYQEIS